MNRTRLDDTEPLLEGSASPTWAIIRVPFRNVARLTVSLPLGGFIFCVVWALYIDREAATYTHCGVRNYLPSVSAAMGHFPVSQTVWRVCIALHAAPRFAISDMYYRYLKAMLFSRTLPFTRITCALNVLENIGLIGLTYVSSTENYSIHEKCFILFMGCSSAYQLMLCGLLFLYRNIPPTSLETKSLKAKWSLVTINLSCVGLACYAFVRHNAYCEEGMYTIFALLEYMVILSNMGFHMTAYWDFYDRVVAIDIAKIIRICCKC